MMLLVLITPRRKLIRQNSDRIASLGYAEIGRVILFTNPSARAGYDTRSIFKRSLTGLNSEFSFS